MGVLQQLVLASCERTKPGTRSLCSFTRNPSPIELPVLTCGAWSATGYTAGVIPRLIDGGSKLVTGGKVNVLGQSLHKVFDGTRFQGAMQKTADWLRLKACFGAGTPIRTPGGWINIEETREGDMVLSRDEHEPMGLVESKRVEELYVRTAPILRLQVNGQVIATTAEHPFYALGKGWTNAGELTADDQLLDIDGRWHLVQAVVDTGEWTTVYNFRVQDHHTYFVGRDEWGFAVWAHNAECAIADVQAVLALEGKKVNSTVASKIGNAIRKDFFDTATEVLGKNGLNDTGAEFAQKVQAYRALRETGMTHAEVAHYFQILGDVQVFRGTTIGFEGHGAKLGPTPVSIDPALATAFATQSANHGSGIVFYGSRANFGGKIGVGNRATPYQILEREVSLPMTATQVAEISPHSMLASRARDILSEMGINVPPFIQRGKQAIENALRDLPRMTPSQISHFLKRAGG